MTPEKKSRIEKLATIAETKWVHFKALGTLNTYGRTAEERTKMMKDYAIAEAEALEAEACLRAAISPSRSGDGQP